MAVAVRALRYLKGSRTLYWEERGHLLLSVIPMWITSMPTAKTLAAQSVRTATLWETG